MAMALLLNKDYAVIAAKKKKIGGIVNEDRCRNRQNKDDVYSTKINDIAEQGLSRNRPKMSTPSSPSNDDVDIEAPFLH